MIEQKEGKTKKSFERLLAPTKTKRRFFFLLVDLVLLTFCYFFSIYLRFGFTFPEFLHPAASAWYILTIALQIAFLAFFGLYNISWRFVGVTEMANILKAGALSLAVLYFLNVPSSLTLFAGGNLPRGVMLIDGFLSMALIGLFRASKRLYFELVTRKRIGKPTLVIGVDFKTERLVQELRFTRSGLYPVVIMDSSPLRQGTFIHGIKVYPMDLNALYPLIKENRIEAALINLPNASHKEIRKIFDRLKEAGVEEIRIVPRLEEWSEEVSQIRKIDIEDLLSRESVKVENQKIQAYLEGRRVLVTGAAGSIGSEIFRRLLPFHPAKIIALDIDETEVFYLQQRLRVTSQERERIVFVVGDVRYRKKMERIFETYRPQVVFHAAAYKHVPLMESFPEEAVETNVLGTNLLANLAVQYGTETFVNISTDKAVNPTSVMGATKRLAEGICSSFNGNTPTRFVSVRFGNVLGSRGSVVPLFLEQIRSGGPLTVTHPGVQRYFMSIPEAVLLVFQAASMGKGGEVFVLDMGEPVKILDLAENLIRLNGMVPYKDVEIVFSGLRPGEKLFEELLTAEEGTDVTTHSKIFVALAPSSLSKERAGTMVSEVEETLERASDLRPLLRRWVPNYREGGENSF